LSIETKTLVFNAVPLFVIAIAYAAVFAVVLPSLWRARSRATAGDVTVATIFPAIAVVAGIYGAIVIEDRQPVQHHLWLAFAAMLFALVPAVVFFGRIVRQGLVSGARGCARPRRGRANSIAS